MHVLNARNSAYESTASPPVMRPVRRNAILEISVSRHSLIAFPLIVVSLAMLIAPGEPARAVGTAIFSDDLESGDLAAWSAVIGGPVPTTVFRISDLDLRDPHVFFDAGALGCADVTDNPFILVPSLNDSLASAITGDDDGDKLLDLSILLLFRDLDLLATGGAVDLARGLCSAPIETTSCSEDPMVVPTALTYDGQDAGLCLMTVPGSTSGYVPAIVEPGAPCFATAPASILVELAGVQVPLEASQISATFIGGPPTRLATGLLAGFLSEADADQLVLPDAFGGGVLSDLLPGGTGSCAAGDDRDLLDAVSGWWFYFAFEADEVPFN